jgi:hypothetical protein
VPQKSSRKSASSDASSVEVDAIAKCRSDVLQAMTEPEPAVHEIDMPTNTTSLPSERQDLDDSKTGLSEAIENQIVTTEWAFGMEACLNEMKIRKQPRLSYSTSRHPVAVPTQASRASASSSKRKSFAHTPHKPAASTPSIVPKSNRAQRVREEAQVQKRQRLEQVILVHHQNGP